MSRLSLTFIFIVVAASAMSCESPRAALYSRLQDGDPAVRVKAAIEAGDQKDKGATPFLVDRLSDSDDVVRFVSFLALKKITGQTNGYDYRDSEQKREQAIAQWRQWLVQNGVSQSRPAEAASTAVAGKEALSK